MGKNQPRSGSLQFWPRKKARKVLPSVNWKEIEKKDNSGLLGFIVYKVGMLSCVVKDMTPDSLTNEKRIVVPVTILEAPSLKIFSIRLYKNTKVVSDILLDSDKELKSKVKLSKKNKEALKELEQVKDFDDIRIIVYSVVKQTGIKKTPDILEIGIGGNLDDKIKFVKENIGIEINFSDIFKELNLVDIRGLTKGHGTQGPVKRFGIGLKASKSEKGQRRPGSIGPWHPARVTFRVPMAGQMGMFTRTAYNKKVIKIGKISEDNINVKAGFKKYGNIKTEYIILEGSIHGPSKRQLILTLPIRKTKKQEKKNYEFIKLE